jgi:hypothetical protein
VGAVVSGVEPLLTGTAAVLMGPLGRKILLTVPVEVTVSCVRGVFAALVLATKGPIPLNVRSARSERVTMIELGLFISSATNRICHYIRMVESASIPYAARAKFVRFIDYSFTLA